MLDQCPLSDFQNLRLLVGAYLVRAQSALVPPTQAAQLVEAYLEVEQRQQEAQELPLQLAVPQQHPR